MKNNIPASIHSFSEKDIAYILNNFEDILNGKSFLSQYKFSEEFEKLFAEYVGTSHAVSCNSGTSALEIIFRSLEIANTEVILPSNTFIATANAIINAGGIPVFADCDETMSLDYSDAVSKITKNTSTICHVHIGGHISESAIKLAEFCKLKGLNFVEDAAQAHGSKYKEHFAGSLGTAAGFSFYSTKVMTTGEGGMITTNNKNLVERMKTIREFGKEKKGIYTNYHTNIGYNWRMPEVASLMGIKQLESLEKTINKRSKIASIYDSILENCSDIEIFKKNEDTRYNHYKYIIFLKNSDRVYIHNEMLKNGIQLSGYVYELPLHKQPVFNEYENLKLPQTEELCSNHISLPIYPSLKHDDAIFAANTLKKLLK